MAQTGLTGKRRLYWVLIIIAVVMLALVVRLFYIQVIWSDELQQKALNQWTKDTSLTAERGRILDRDGTVLAQSGTAYKLLVWPNQIENPERVATELSKVLGMNKDTLLEKITNKKQKEIVIKRQLERETVDTISALKLGKGVVTALDTKRYYPGGDLFSQLLGFTTIDGIGQEGIESSYNKYLAGTDGRMIVETDRVGNPLAYGVEEYIDAEDGSDLVLTTDSVIQSFLIKALKEALKVNNALSAQGIVMNCKTGEILAIATAPDYDPNDPPREDLDLLRELVRNRVASDAYEPGSTFKILTLSAALDSGAINDNFSVYCPGYHYVNGERVRCWKSGGHGSQTLVKAVENSCNVAFMQMAQKMGVEKFYDYIYAFGMGTTTGSGLPGESGGIVTHEKYITQNTLARIGFGQSIAVTPIQLAAAVSAAVNGGNLMQPYIVDKIVSPNGAVIQDMEPTVIRQVISEQTSARVREILESVVENGSGRNAQIAGYRVGGKTGTAQKYDETGASSSKLIASFVGFAPADDPEYVCLILVDEPKVGTIFGSTVAAPFVKQVMEETLRHYGYLPETTEEQVQVPDVTGMSVAEATTALRGKGLSAVSQAYDDVTDQIPRAGEWVVKGTDVLLYTLETRAEEPEDTESTLVTVPDLSGCTRLEAYDKLAELGLKIEIDPPDQTGKAILQKPSAGAKVEEGSSVFVEFSDIDF
ncbi:MAG: penicillin-binding transpeptidase domain-containing protein [Bacillota bacterium]